MKGLKVLKTICFLYFSGVLACPTIDESTNEANANVKEEDKETCNEIFANNGMNYSTFYEGAAHGIHSLRLSIMLSIYIYNAEFTAAVMLVRKTVKIEGNEFR